MPIALQAKLLRTIETRQVLPVGAVKPRSLDVRYMAATNRDLEAEVAGGGFRQDLFFRLNGISLVVPPLRARTNEIPALVETFVRECCEESGREPPRVSSDAMDYLFGYAWPGNIRELRNVIERALVLCDEGEIGPHHLPLDKMRAHPGGLLRSSPGISARLPSGGQDDGNVIGVKAPNDGDRFPWRDDPARVAERKRILDALEAHVWNQTRAAEALGMPRRTFVAKLEYFRIPRPQKGGGG